jgi:hypothetical protein
MADIDERFDDWLRALEEDVIQDGFGYEPGEFTVYPDHWRPMFDEGLTPTDAWTRALDAYSALRREREDAKQANYDRISVELARGFKDGG